MDKEENPAKDKGVTGGKPKEKSSSGKGKSRKSAKWKIPVAIRVAIIGSITTIVTTVVLALPNLLPLIPVSQPDPSSTSTPASTISPTAINTETLLLSPTDTPTIVMMPLLTLTPTITLIPTETATIQPSPAPVFIVHLVADKTTGRSPLIVKFDARDSIFHESNGTQFSCRAGTCYYTWRVYSGGQPIGRAENNTSGRFEYTFRDKGAYTVTVYICRGQDRVDCGSSAAWIQVAR